MKILLGAMGLMWGLAPIGHALAPVFLSDRQLADQPVMVVAKWEGAPFDNVEEGWAMTSVKVLSVLKGEAKLGVQKVELPWGLCWEPAGNWVRCATSTEMPADVEDVSEPCLWLCERREDGELRMINYRCVQPFELREYFKAVSGKQPETDVPELLSTKDPVVLHRALAYIAGGALPWPDAPDDPDDIMARNTTPSDRWPPLREVSGGVKAIIPTAPEEVRRIAVSVYAHLAGKKSRPLMRALLEDRDATVRATAVGVLARLGDDKKTELWAPALQGLGLDYVVAPKLLGVLAKCDGAGAVPALIELLENDGWGNTAIGAREALFAKTGFWFPFDVESAGERWRKGIEGQESRDCPFKLEQVGDLLDRSDDEYRKKAMVVKVTNLSDEPASLLREPSSVEMRFEKGTSGYGYHFERQKLTDGDFADVAPGESFEIEVAVGEDFLLAAGERKLILEFLRIGAEVGVNAWIGEMEIVWPE